MTKLCLFAITDWASVWTHDGVEMETVNGGGIGGNWLPPPPPCLPSLSLLCKHTHRSLSFTARGFGIVLGDVFMTMMPDGQDLHNVHDNEDDNDDDNNNDHF